MTMLLMLRSMAGLSLVRFGSESRNGTLLVTNQPLIQLAATGLDNIPDFSSALLRSLQ